MKLYLSTDYDGAISGRELYLAETQADMYLTNEVSHGSRYADTSRVWEFNGYGGNVKSNRAPNTRNPDVRHYERAATWDQWGILLSILLDLDPDMKVGSHKLPYYDGADDFHNKTGGRFKDVRSLSDLPDFHGDHRFKYDPSVGGFTERGQRCSHCSAVVIY